MKQLGRALARILCLGLLVIAVPVSSVHAAPSLLIGEVNWAGSSLSTADEWIELWNLGDDPLPLDGYRLTGAGGLNGISFGPNDVIAPHGTWLVSNYSASDIRSVLNTTPQTVTTTLSLLNDALGVQLLDASNVLIDQAGDGKLPPAGSSGTPKTSMIRSWPLGDGAIKTSWISATSSAGFDGGVMDLGTPGLCDQCLAASTSASSTTQIPTTSSTTQVTESPTSTTQETTSSTNDGLNLPDPTSTSTSLSDGDVSTSNTSTPISLGQTSSTSDLSTTSTTEADQTATSTSTGSAETDITSTGPIDPGQQQPVAQLSIHGALAVNTDTVFDASSSTDPNGDPLLFLWNFGDGATSTEAIATHTYTTSGIFLVSLIVSDRTFSDEVTTTLEIAPPAITPDPDLPNKELEVYLLSISPNPSTGSEWMELSGVSSTSDLVGWTVSDADRVILTIKTDTRFTQPTSSTIRIFLPGRRLNNTGDRLTLRDAVGSIVDKTAFPKTRKEQLWMRLSPDDPWRLDPPTLSASSSSIAQVDGSLTTSQAKRVTVVHEAIAKAEKTSQQNTSTKTSKKTETSAVLAPSIEPAAKKNNPTQKTSKSITNVSTKTTKPKSSLTTAHKINWTMLTDIESGTRVTLQGTVASVPGLLSKQQFIIQNSDGRGLLIQGNSQQPSPALGSAVLVTGTLIQNDQGLTLRMYAQDRWSTVTLNTDKEDIVPHEAYLLAPDAEDAWSLVAVTGTVRSVKASVVEMEVDGIPLDLVIRPVVKFRAARLLAGDTIRIRGVLDTRYDVPRILPRQASEIELVSHEEKKKPQTSATASSVPPWAPFGAAGATIAITHGVKRLKKRHEEKRLAGLLKQATENLNQLSS